MQPWRSSRVHNQRVADASSNWREKGEKERRREDPQSQDGSRPSGSTDAVDGSLSANEPTARLYVGNLLYTVQPVDIKKLFSSHGVSVVNLDMSIDPMSGRNPSYCFVDFESPEEASRAQTVLSGVELFGRPLKIRPGVPKKPKSGIGLWTKSSRREWKFEEAHTDYQPSFDRWKGEDATSHWTQPQVEGKRLYVGGLPRMEPQSAVDSAMQTLFAGFPITAVSKIISPYRDPSASAPLKGDHYYLFVDLKNAEDVEHAIAKLHDSQSPWRADGSQRLRVQPAKDNRDRKVFREQRIDE